MGILAHVDAGKTSLTERLLYAAGVIDHVGRVDDGNTRTDSMELERRRGITIRSAVVSFELGDLTVNLIDTPGHSDFIAEVERALSVLDGAVLVISAVEGVQVQTRLLMRTLGRLRIPTLLFVNKIDRMGARYDELLADIARLLTPAAVPMGSVAGLGTRTARYWPFPPVRPALGELLANGNDIFCAGYLDDLLGEDDYRRELSEQVRRARVHPVYFGSAMTGEGVADLIDGIREWLPRATGRPAEPLRASVFKVERGTAGERIASARVFAGQLHARQPIDVHRGSTQYEVKPTAVRVFERGGTRPVECAEAGRIVALRGLKQVQIGDQLGTPTGPDAHLFAPPTLETAVLAADRVKLFQALQQLAEQDPLIRVRKNPFGQLSVNLYGEVQKEVIASLLQDEYGLAVTFSETTPIHIERPVRIGTAVRGIGDPGNPWCAAVGFRVSPAPVGTGIGYRMEVELGALPRAFHNAIEETARAALEQGLSGWEVLDCRVDLIHTRYSAPVTVAADFRRLVPLVLMQALQQAGTRVYEPVNSFELELPPDAVSSVISKLAEAGATLENTVVAPERTTLTGLIPASRVHSFEAQLPGLTHGEGVLLAVFSGYHPVPGHPPVRPRTDGNPLNHGEYLLHLNQSS
ncbi:elongation factor G [Kribbella sp. CA-293567]|uniref:elongation factor G n=1 Tax=Kribbella sp. CA-293567 TaxID=3002436 RepID=UPI0022DDE559|nr:TetM/TetW/TetO/TetS family tetracycline resistance ribosomal protection protein [Kribbella sp. CA-293567]WBQ06769.1 TetM/TetW/TetO/TetS family tetracycline resistance ribosomal protection protein [Kribbella sp. CA-293567]